MRVLIVKYLPSGEDSNTLKLLNHFKSNLKYHIIEELDLVQAPVMQHNFETMQAYKKRNFGGQMLNPEQEKSIAPMDKLAKQFSKVDLVVLATPMHNFSLPGAVKLYFDAIMQSGVTFKYEGEKQIGLMDKTKFLTLYSSMGGYNGEYGFLDNLKTLVKIELDFMSFKEYEFIHAITGNKTTYDTHMQGAFDRISLLIDKWKL